MSNRLNLLSLVLLCLFFAFISFALLPKLFNDLASKGIIALYGDGWESAVMYWTYIIFLIGFLVYWKNKKVAGMIIILASWVQMLPFLIIDQNFGSLIFGIPLLFIGVLIFSFNNCDKPTTSEE